MVNPYEISVGKKNTGAENVEHHYYLVHAKDRYLALKRIADIHPTIYSIIFCRTRAETKEVADKLMHDGYNADALHGDLSQTQRDHVMARFRGKHLQMLVATDVAARGLDVNDLTHVINYNLPDDPEIYIHRSGRTGRAGKRGVSITLIHMREKGKLRDVERKVDKKFVQVPVPNGKEICEKQLFSLIDKVEKVEVKDEQIAQFMPVIYKKLAWLDREELIKHFVSLEFNRFLKYYQNTKDINVDESRHSERDFERSGKRREKGKKDRKRKGYDFTRFFFSLGKKNGINKRAIIDLINQNTPGKSIEIGNIEVLKGFSFFEIDSSYQNDIVKAFKKARFNGQKVNIEIANKKKK
jgi:ATP-dependent RNA helicase DeaD